MRVAADARAAARGRSVRRSRRTGSDHRANQHADGSVPRERIHLAAAQAADPTAVPAVVRIDPRDARAVVPTRVEPRAQAAVPNPGAAAAAAVPTLAVEAVLQAAAPNPGAAADAVAAAPTLAAVVDAQARAVPTRAAAERRSRRNAEQVGQVAVRPRVKPPGSAERAPRTTSKTCSSADSGRRSERKHSWEILQASRITSGLAEASGRSIAARAPRRNTPRANCAGAGAGPSGPSRPGRGQPYRRGHAGRRGGRDEPRRAKSAQSAGGAGNAA